MSNAAKKVFEVDVVDHLKTLDGNVESMLFNKDTQAALAARKAANERHDKIDEIYNALIRADRAYRIDAAQRHKLSHQTKSSANEFMVGLVKPPEGFGILGINWLTGAISRFLKMLLCLDAHVSKSFSPRPRPVDQRQLKAVEKQFTQSKTALAEVMRSTQPKVDGHKEALLESIQRKAEVCNALTVVRSAESSNKPRKVAESPRFIQASRVLADVMNDVYPNTSKAGDAQVNRVGQEGHAAAVMKSPDAPSPVARARERMVLA